MPLVLQAATSGSTTLIAPDTVTVNATLPVGGGNLLSTANPQSGGVIQVVSAFKSDVFSTTNASYTDVTGLSVAITPKFATSKILVLCNIQFGSTGDSVIQLVRNGSAIAGGTSGSLLNGFSSASSSVTSQPNSGNLSFLDSPATTSALTYKIQTYAYSGIAYVNQRGMNNSFGASSTITLMEIAA